MDFMSKKVQSLLYFLSIKTCRKLASLIGTLRKMTRMTTIVSLGSQGVAGPCDTKAIRTITFSARTVHHKPWLRGIVNRAWSWRKVIQTLIENYRLSYSTEELVRSANRRMTMSMMMMKSTTIKMEVRIPTALLTLMKAAASISTPKTPHSQPQTLKTSRDF